MAWRRKDEEKPPPDTLLQVTDGEHTMVGCLGYMGWTYITAFNKLYFAFARDFIYTHWDYLLPSPHSSHNYDNDSRIKRAGSHDKKNIK